MVLDTQRFIDWLTGVGLDADEARSFVDALNEDRAELLTVADFTAAMSGLSGDMAQHRGETREQLATLRKRTAGLHAESAELRAESREQHAETLAMMREDHAALLTQMATMRADVIEAMDLEAERSADRLDEQISAWRNQTIPLLRLVVGLGLANFAAVIAVLIRVWF